MFYARVDIKLARSGPRITAIGLRWHHVIHCMCQRAINVIHPQSITPLAQCQLKTLMATPSTERIQQAATKLLEEAHVEGKLRHVIYLLPCPVTLSRLMPIAHCSKLTVRIVRERLEESLDLSPGTLDAKEYKTSIKKTVVDYLVRQSSQPGIDLPS